MVRRRRQSSDYYGGFFPPSTPLEAKGGIKAQSKRGQFGQSWWAKRWITVLESFNIGARLGRGRSYARKGQVTSIKVDKGGVHAEVQGSRASVYKVEIKVKALPKAKWKRLAKNLSKQAIFAAKLLAGEMPENIEDAFREEKLSLFPEKIRDLKTDCTCPDWSNPCKHIAAVYYLLGEEFDRDPFLIFKLRGIERDEFIGLLHSEDIEKGGNSKSSLVEKVEPPKPQEPLPTDPEAFWGQVDSTNVCEVEVCIPPVAAALPKQLGKFPLWRGEENLQPKLEEIYLRASAVGMDMFLGQSE